MFMKQKTQSPVMTLRETQRMFDGRASYATVWKWARQGYLPTVTIGKKTFVLREAFLKLLNVRQ
jgi:hypothetical protein